MPELPEVETIKRDLEKLITGLKIVKVEVLDQRVIQGNLKAFFNKVSGKTIQQIERKGKSIVLAFKEKGFLIAQPKMTGQLVFHKAGLSNWPKDTKVVFTLSNKNVLCYNDQRTFGKLTFCDDLKDIKYLHTLGLDPMNGQFSVSWLIEKLPQRKTPIKVLLMDQHFVSGIGNIYASEILFSAKIAPTRQANRLSSAESKELFTSTQKVLKEAIEHRGSSLRNYRDGFGNKGGFIKRIKVYGRDNEPCYNCQTILQRIVQAQRSTFFCPVCQK